MGQLRSSNEVYLKYTRLFWQELFGRLKPYMVINGGPILMVQIENVRLRACGHIMSSSLQICMIFSSLVQSSL